MSRLRPVRFLVAGLISLAALPAAAQFGPPSPDRMFDFVDKDHDGRLSRGEIEGAPGFFRGRLEQAGIRDGADRNDFLGRMERTQGDSGRGGSDRGGSDRGGRDRGGSDRGSDRGDRGGSDRGGWGGDRGDDRGNGDSGRRSQPAPPTVYKPAPKPRVTVDLHEDFRGRDVDGDGQIGLNEWRLWDRGRIEEFFDYDWNGDGFLTPREIAAGPQPRPVPDAATETAENPIAVKGKELFGLLDLNKDGVASPNEWPATSKLRPTFEQAGIKTDADITEAQFVAGYVRTAPR